MASRYALGLAAVIWVSGLGCTGTVDPPVSDAGPGSGDGGVRDGATDARRDGASDTGGAPDDAGDTDVGIGDLDAGEADAGEPDAGEPDAGEPDAGTGAADSGAGDAGSTDPDSGPAPTDAGPPDAGDLPPVCQITAPLTGTTQDFDNDFTFVATASDPQDGPLTEASVVWRSDRVVAPLGSGLSATALLEPGTHVITCTATDSAGNVGTNTITVISRSPVAVINHPGDGETRVAASTIPFVGVGRDFEDGALTGAALVWTSSIDGMIGTGVSFNRMLSPGTNVITLTVTDSDGNTGTDTVTLTITP